MMGCGARGRREGGRTFTILHPCCNTAPSMRKKPAPHFPGDIRMPRPRDIAAIDTLIGFRDYTHAPAVASERVKWEKHPAEYMFKDLPEALAGGETRDSSIEETLAQMDEFNIAVGVVHTND